MDTVLNVKSNYTLLSSMLRIDDIISYAKKNNMTSIALCDTNMYGTMEFYNKCRKNDIKPIIGLSLILDDFNLCVYAKNYKGYKNLIKLSTIQNENKMSLEVVKKYTNNLVGIIPFNCADKYEEIKDLYEDSYLGYSNKEEENKAKKITKNIVFFKECLYKTASDSEYLTYLYRIRDAKTVNDEVVYSVLNKELDMNTANYTSNEGLNNTLKIEALCNLEIEKEGLLLPIYEVPKGIKQEEYLFELAKKGLKKRLGSINDIYQKRLSYELNVITKMGFTNYFLVVYDFIRYAKKSNILVGPGRGSAAGSLVSYSLGITEIDPIKYDLLFERFLNPERISMPDIDTDFPDDKRDLVIDYVKEKYGQKHVAGIVTFGSLSAKAVIRDVGRVLDVPSYKIDSLSKIIPNFTKDKLKDFYKNNERFKAMIDSDSILKNVYKIALKFEGFPRHTSSHAAGIVMCKYPLDEVLPLTVSDDMYLTSYSMDYLEDLGLLKMDFLGLRNLSLIADVLDNVEKLYGEKISFNEIKLDDKKAIEVFQKANTSGIFQFESSGMREFLKKLVPNSFEDIFAAIALFRPGPAGNIDTFIRRKHGEEKITYIDKSLEPILKNTYGIFVYQEQVMQAANIYAGYSLAESDLLRRAMSKKKTEVLQNEEKKFIEKSVAKGHDRIQAKKIFDLILRFAGYGFNRSHSVAYSLIAYKMAYLKVHYQLPFYAAILSNVTLSPVKTNEYILEARERGIEVLSPSINNSDIKYKVVDEKIYVPFSLIRKIGIVTSKTIIEARGKEKFKDIYDAFSRLYIGGVTKKSLEYLVYAGAFEEFGYNRKTLIDSLDSLIDYATLTKDIEPSLVEKPIIEREEEFDKLFLLEKERELYDFYLTYHPTTLYFNKCKEAVKIKDIESNYNKIITLIGLVDYVKKTTTKKGESMAFVTISDDLSKTSVTLFPKQYDKVPRLKRGNIVKVEGKVEKRYNEYQIVANKIEVIEEKS